MGMERFLIDSVVKCLVSAVMKLYDSPRLGSLLVICLQEMLIADVLFSYNPVYYESLF